MLKNYIRVPSSAGRVELRPEHFKGISARYYGFAIMHSDALRAHDHETCISPDNCLLLCVRPKKNIKMSYAGLVSPAGSSRTRAS